MKQLYVITESGGQYDDAWEHARFVTDDREKAELYCNNQTQRILSLKEKKDIVDEWIEEWTRTHPRPEMLPYVEKPIPSWPSNVKVTDEMRATRKQIQEENANAITIACAPVAAWQKARTAAVKEYKEANFSQDVITQLNDINSTDSYWSFEEVEWLE